MSEPLIKTRFTTDTLALALARQQRWVDRHTSMVTPEAPREPKRMAKATLRTTRPRLTRVW